VLIKARSFLDELNLEHLTTGAVVKIDKTELKCKQCSQD